METRLQNVTAGKAQSKTRKLLYLKEEKKNGHVILIFQQNSDEIRDLLRFRPRRPNKPGLSNNKSQIKVTELESSRYRGLLGVYVTYS